MSGDPCVFRTVKRSSGTGDAFAKEVWKLMCCGVALPKTCCGKQKKVEGRLICMTNDIIEELLDLDMEPKPESLRWTSTHKDEEKTTLRVVSRAKAWELPFS